MPSLLVIDDEPSILHAFRRAFKRPDLKLLTAATGQEGFQAVVDHQPDVVVLDINLPDGSGLDIFRQIHEHDARIPVIFITGHGTTETAIEAMKLGAFDYLLKPLELAPLEALLDRAVQISRLMRVPAQIEDETPQEGADLIIGRCAAMQDIYKSIGRIAPQDVTVLILGETGTGKELIARAIYQHSRRAGGPFLAINCAAIPEALLESELFGYEKGAFTGAERRRIGKFEQCSGGTLFLDEIGDMSPLTQAKILRVLQDQQFERVGGNEIIQANVRIIAATNRDLLRMIGEEEFRSDLYYRLSVFTITLPPLRDRGDDLVLLIQYFLKRFGRELGKDVKDISPEALSVLRGYSWPGNMRELQSVIKQALLHATGPLLLPDFLPPLAQKDGGAIAAETLGIYSELDRLIQSELQAESPNVFETILNEVKRRLLTQALHQTANNQVRAAKALGISRSTLRNELRSLGISVEKQINTTDDEPV